MDDPQRDKLTGVLSFRELARKDQRSGIAVFVDVDGLIWVNDHSGYAVGDQALILIATALSCLKAGSVFRVGGDEFLVMLPEPNVDDALTVAARAVESVRALAIPYQRVDRPHCVRLEVNAVVFQFDAEILSRGISGTGLTQELRNWFGNLLYLHRDRGRPSGGIVVDARAQRWHPAE